MRNVISIRVQNVPGVLSHVAGLLASRGYNVDSLTVGATDDPKFSRMTIVLECDPKTIMQVERQLTKLVTVVETKNLSDCEHVERDLALIRVAVTTQERSSVLELVEIFRASVIDVGQKSLLIEISGRGSKLDAFIKALAPFKIVSVTRSGCIAALRGDVELDELNDKN
ncbi:MAG: acetolactate synthase small subunit [Thermoguttaceae bacterium]|nr:acetolactate synthase small subunit [Thermoguttaceae bacterium]